MTKIVNKTSEIPLSGYVFYIQSLKDIEVLKKYTPIEKNIEKKLRSIVKEKKDVFQEFFIGSSKITSLFVYYSWKKDKKQTQIFLGNHIKKLSDKVTIFCIDQERDTNLMDTLLLSRYSYSHYKKDKPKKHHTIFTPQSTNKFFQKRHSLLENIMFARDLGEMPSNDLTPEAFVKKVKSIKFKNTKIKVLPPKTLEKKWLGLITAVWKWSENKPYMVILERIVDKKLPTMGIVGKGITFDTWGIQVKPENYMYEMKGDMGWAAVTLALMKELDDKNVNINIVACLCLAENSISSTSYKPSDIIKGYTGKTVEIIHTDAEGRLVLADGISYVGKNYKTSHMMTIATLTGACIAALGHRYAGVMWTDKKMINRILSYSDKNAEQYMELPFDEYFIEKTKSDIADYKNLDRGVQAGSSMWGAFLSNFLENKELYTHLDIAGVYLNSEAYGKVNSGATGFGVESLSDILQSV